MRANNDNVISVAFLQQIPLIHAVEITRQNLVNVGSEVTFESLTAQDFHPTVAKVLMKRATKKFCKQKG